MKKFLVALAGLIAVPAAFAATTYNLPDPVVYAVASGTTTTVVISGVVYRGPSQFVYFSECPRPDGTGYHCNIMVENDVVLVAADGSTAIVNLTVQFAGVLIRSGHNYWRNSAIVLAGDVTAQ